MDDQNAVVRFWMAGLPAEIVDGCLKYTNFSLAAADKADGRMAEAAVEILAADLPVAEFILETGGVKGLDMAFFVLYVIVNFRQYVLGYFPNTLGLQVGFYVSVAAQRI